MGLQTANPSRRKMNFFRFRFTSEEIRDYTGGQDGVATYFGFDATHVFTSYRYHNSINSRGQYDGLDLSRPYENVR